MLNPQVPDKEQQLKLLQERLIKEYKSDSYAFLKLFPTSDVGELPIDTTYVTLKFLDQRSAQSYESADGTFSLRSHDKICENAVLLTPLFPAENTGQKYK